MPLLFDPTNDQPTESYLLDISSAIQVPAIVYEAAQRALTHPQRLILAHNEPVHINRGRNQPIKNSQSGLEVRRPDGGHSWYHGNTTCYMETFPITTAQQPAQRARQLRWGEGIIDDLVRTNAFAREELYFENSDVFYRNGTAPKHVAGTSGYTLVVQGTPVAVLRCCFYPSDPTDSIDVLLHIDGIDPQDFRARSKPLPGHREHLIDHMRPIPKSATSYVGAESLLKAQALQTLDPRGDSYSCVMGPHYPYHAGHK